MLSLKPFPCYWTIRSPYLSWMIHKARPSANKAPPRSHLCSVSPLMHRGMLHCMCNDCARIRVRPVERDIKGSSYKGRTSIWPPPALLSGEVPLRSSLVFWALGDEWLCLVGRLLQFHTNWGVNTRSKCGNWVTWLWLLSFHISSDPASESNTKPHSPLFPPCHPSCSIVWFNN